MTDTKLKRSGSGLGMRTFQSEDDKNTYIVFKQPDGSYHTFVEVEAKQSAVNCGSGLGQDSNTRTHWDKLWGDS